MIVESITTNDIRGLVVADQSQFRKLPHRSNLLTVASVNFYRKPLKVIKLIAKPWWLMWKHGWRAREEKQQDGN